MQTLNIFSSITNWVNDMTDFFNNLKILFQNSIDFLPKEILAIFIPTLIVIIGLFIYRFVR